MWGSLGMKKKDTQSGMKAGMEISSEGYSKSWLSEDMSLMWIASYC